MVACGLGWTWEQVETDMDLPRYLALLSFWSDFPPMFMVAGALIGGGTKGGRRNLGHGFENYVPPQDNSLPDMALAGQVPGVQVGKVPFDYADKKIAEVRAFTEEFVRRSKEAGTVH